MPQKRNPISSVYITALNSVVRQQVAALLDAMVEDHERATGPWEIEWIVLPEIFCLTAGALAQTLFVLTGLQVDEKKMRANLDLTKGLIVSEAVMMGLGPYLGRQYAHDLVYDICRKVVATGRPLADLLAENRKSPSISTAPRWKNSAIRRIILAKPARWWIACWPCAGNEADRAADCGEPARGFASSAYLPTNTFPSRTSTVSCCGGFGAGPEITLPPLTTSKTLK